jgi:hypothetical protein
MHEKRPFRTTFRTTHRRSLAVSPRGTRKAGLFWPQIWYNSDTCFELKSIHIKPCELLFPDHLTTTDCQRTGALCYRASIWIMKRTGTQSWHDCEDRYGEIVDRNDEFKDNQTPCRHKDCTDGTPTNWTTYWGFTLRYGQHKWHCWVEVEGDILSANCFDKNGAKEMRRMLQASHRREVRSLRQHFLEWLYDDTPLLH